MKPDYYEILGVDRTASHDEIRSAYRRLSKQWHPDLNHSPEAKDKFAEINEAYETLGSEDKRREYDNPSPFGGFGNGTNGFRDANGNVHFSWSSDGSHGGFDPFDLFGSLYGRSHGGFRRYDPNAPRPGEDIMLVLNIGFFEAINVCTKKIRMNVEDDGDSPNTRRMKTITMDVKIPKGCPDGQRLRVPGQGNKGWNGGPNGDIYFVIHHPEHEVFKRKGYDIFVEKWVPFETFVLGGKVRIPTMNGNDVEYDVPPITYPEHIAVLKGKGSPIMNTLNSNGDMMAILHLEMPEHLTDKELDLLKQYRDERKSHI